MDTKVEIHIVPTKREASEVAALIADAMQRSGAICSRITRSTLEVLAGRPHISRSLRRRISHEAEQLGYALFCFDYLKPTEGTAIISLAAIQREPTFVVINILTTNL